MNLFEAKQELREHGYTLLKEGLFGYDADKVKDKIEQVLALCKTNTEHFGGSSEGEAITPLYIFANSLKRLLKDIEKGDDVNWHIKYFLKDKDSHYVSLYCKDDSYVDALRKAWNDDKIDDDKFQQEKGKTQFIKTTRFRKEVGGELENLGIIPLYKKATTKEVRQNLKDEYDFVVYIPLDISKIFKD